MSDSTPSPPSASLVPHHVSRDPPFDGDDKHPLPIVPDASIGGGCATIARKRASLLPPSPFGASGICFPHSWGSMRHISRRILSHSTPDDAVPRVVVRRLPLADRGGDNDDDRDRRRADDVVDDRRGARRDDDARDRPPPSPLGAVRRATMMNVVDNQRRRCTIDGATVGIPSRVVRG
jgi:hypothetical protein